MGSCVCVRIVVMMWCRGGVKGVHMYIDVSEDLAVEDLGVIV